MNYADFTKKLVVPPDFEAPRTLTYENLVAEALERSHLDDDVQGINASIELIQRTRGGAWPTLTKSQFVAEANAICAQTEKEAAAFKNDYPGPGSTPAQEQKYLQEIAPVARETAAKIAALPAPAGDQEEVAAAKDGISREATAFAKGASSPQGADAVINDSTLYERTDKATKAYGLTKC